MSPGAQAGSLTDSLHSDSKATGKARGSSRTAGLNFADASGDTDWAALQTAETNKWERLHFSSAQPRARSPAQDTEGAREARDSHEQPLWSVFLLRFIYSFVYFREILPREQVRLSALTQG